MKVESDVLRRLGPVPFWRGTGKCLDELGKIYRKASEACRRRLEAETMPGAASPSVKKGMS